MIVSRAPLRMSFLGGGSDLPAFYEQQPGCVLSTALDYYVHLAVSVKFNHRIRASYSVTEIVDRLDELQNDRIRECLRLVGIEGGLEVVSVSDIPSGGTGLGSSSSFTVALLHALYAHLGIYVSAERLAREACLVEMDRCACPIGKQDQYAAAYGGFNFLEFEPDGTVRVEPVICHPETRRALQANLLLMYTGTTRSADAILAEQQRNTTASADTRALLAAMAELAREGRKALCHNDPDELGLLLHEGWMLKRRVASGVSNPQIDAWYERAMNRGALGGKLLGAGGGGFLLFYASPAAQPGIVAELAELRPVPFGLGAEGSRIVYYDEPRQQSGAGWRIARGTGVEDGDQVDMGAVGRS